MSQTDYVYECDWHQSFVNLLLTVNCSQNPLVGILQKLLTYALHYLEAQVTLTK